MLLDNLYTQKYLIFLDIEFQNFQPKQQQIHHIQELGILIFERGKEDPVLVEHVNFPILTIKNMRLIGVEYSNVTEKIEKEMEKIQQKFTITPSLDDLKTKEKLIKFIPDKNVRNILKDSIRTSNNALLGAANDQINKRAKKAMFNYYYNRLPNEYKTLFTKQVNLYKNDTNVIKRLVDPKEYLNRLNNYFKNGLLVHKERTDLEALKNDFNYYKINGSVNNNFDIAIYNRFFERLNAASLHNSYLHLYEDKIKKDQDMLKYHDKLIEIINKKMLKFRAHNPLVDAFMTIFIFILMK